MMGHNICFYEEILLIIPNLSLLSLLIWSTVQYGHCYPLKMEFSPTGMNVLKEEIILSFKS